jgi:transposase
MNTNYREVARLLAMGPNTEREYRQALDRAGLLAGGVEELPSLETLMSVVLAAKPVKPLRQHESSVATWRPLVEEKLRDGAQATAIFDYLRLEKKEELKGTLSAIKRLCVAIRRENGIDADDVAIPVENAPGEIAQVDFGDVGLLWDPDEQRERKAYVFVMVLGYSRQMFARVVFDQRVETWLELHVQAFQALGGVPRVIVPDNLKAAVIRAAFGCASVSTLNRAYRELARHFGFKIDPTPARSPQKKGKVEAGVKYVKRNFFRSHKDQRDAEKLQAALQRWLAEIAGQRIHGTTRQSPAVLFEEVERAKLLPLPPTPWKPVAWRSGLVHRDAHVLIEKALYSVPWRLIDKKVLSRVTQTSVEIYLDDVRVATHDRAASGQRKTHDEHLPPERRELRHRSPDHWIERAQKLGQDVGSYVLEVLDSDRELSQLRAVQQIVLCLEKVPVERASAACRRAQFYANYTYLGIKTILAKGLDQEPLPNAVLPTSAGLTKPRFARDVRELIALPLEMTDAPQ